MPLGVDEEEHSIEMHLPYIRAVFGSAPLQLVPVLVGALTPQAEQLYGAALTGAPRFEARLPALSACRVPCAVPRGSVPGRVLAGYLDDPENLFIVSSDFCHWRAAWPARLFRLPARPRLEGIVARLSGGWRRRGKRFSYTPFAEEGGGTGGNIADAIEAMDRQGMALVEQQAPERWTAYLAELQNTVCGRHPIGVFLNMLQHCAGRYDVRFVRYEQSSRVRSLADSSVSYATAVVTAVAGQQ